MPLHFAHSRVQSLMTVEIRAQLRHVSKNTLCQAVAISTDSPRECTTRAVETSICADLVDAESTRPLAQTYSLNVNVHLEYSVSECNQKGHYSVRMLTHRTKRKSLLILVSKLRAWHSLAQESAEGARVKVDNRLQSS